MRCLAFADLKGSVEELSLPRFFMALAPWIALVVDRRVNRCLKNKISKLFFEKIINGEALLGHYSNL